MPPCDSGLVNQLNEWCSCRDVLTEQLKKYALLKNSQGKSWNRTIEDGCPIFQPRISGYRPKGPISESPMTTILVKCECLPCTCNVDEFTAVKRGNKLFCSEACATGHIDQKPGLGGGSCGCGCGCWSTSDYHPESSFNRFKTSNSLDLYWSNSWLTQLRPVLDLSILLRHGMAA